ncbi:hypothetical protein Pyn_17964 [Prunus yedoensis var. nudiflora]|uniref:LRR receptor-like serine/threonine-protein kinase n=1 Tax=Prunus yedoensis var. nudiflora TaxID=2094558 RepID=A0A314ZT51_PRUYE|nr:hypothetical protein Pyn_17964 [Prunus yedoensis var. nudiflora]
MASFSVLWLLLQPMLSQLLLVSCVRGSKCYYQSICEVTALISIFKQWDMQALPISGGEQCIGFAINGSEFEKLSSRHLKLDLNYFTGLLPAFIGNMSALTVLPIPKEPGNLKELTMLYIDSCGLGGEISSTFAKLINMKILYASDNPFSGKIPSIIGNWRKLTSLQVWQTFNLLQFMKADLHG